MSLLLSEDFETGSNGTPVTTSNTIFDLVSSTGVTISTAWSVGGTRCVDCNASSSAASGRVPLGSAQNIVAEVVHFRIVGSITPAANVAILNARNGATIKAEVQMQTNGRIRIRDNGSQVWSSGSALPTDTDLRAEWLVNATAGTQELNVYTKNGSTPLSGQASGSQAYTGGSIDTLVLGIISSTTYHVRFDTFAVYTSAADLPKPYATSPTVVIGADPTIQDYHSYAFTPTVTGNAGTTTYTWSVDSGPDTSTSQFSTTSAKNTTFSPSGPGTFVLKLVVHDDSGDTPATSTVTVTALLTADGVDSAITTTSWTASTGTVEQVLRGDVAGYITSANNPSSLDLKYRMRGIVPPSGDYTHTLPALGRSGGTGTVDVSLYKPDGSTLVKKISGVEAKTTPEDTTVAFLAADITALTAANWRAGVVILVEATAS